MKSRFGLTFGLALFAHVAAMGAWGSFGMFAIVLVPLSNHLEII